MNRSRTPLVLAVVLVVAGVVALVAVVVTRGDGDDGDTASSVPAPGATSPGSAGGTPSGGGRGVGTTRTRMAAKPQRAMNASVTKPSSRNQMAAHEGPTPQAPPSNDGFHSIR